MLEIFAEKVNKNVNIALAVSGGADSICMTLLCHQLGLTPIILIVDHKLRDESSDEALYVKNYIEENFNFKTKILVWERYKNITSNIQSQARDARYKLLISECKQLGIENLYTAHNKNDQAETVLINIMRGTGIDGLVGIREDSVVDSIEILRPMLCFTREEIESYLKLYNISWVNDPSNDSTKYERVKVRKLIKSISDSDLVNAQHLISRLNLLSENARRSQRFIERYVDKKIDEICQSFHMNVVIVDIVQLIIEEEEIILRILRRLLKIVGKQENYVRGERLIKLYKKLLSNNNQFSATLGGCLIWNGIKNSRNVLVLSQESIKSQYQINKNEVKALEEAFYRLKSEYIVYNEDVYYKAKKIVANVPRVHKLLSAIQYELVDGKRFYHSLGIAKILD